MEHRGLIGIDLGTSSVKVVIVDRTDGRLLGAASASYPIDRPQPGHAEQAPERWWRATIDAARRALANADHPPIDAIGLSGQMHGTVLIDRALRPLAPAIIWADQRSASQAAGIERELGSDLLRISGSRVASGFQGASLRWLVEHEPALIDALHKVLLPKDYIRLRLTGDLATDPADAAGTLLFDLHRGDWSEPLIAASQVDPDWLPPIVPSHAISGRLGRDAALALGLPPGIPVATGTADAPAAALGAGVVDPGSLLITLSSGAQVYAPLTSPAIDPLGRIHTFSAPSPLDPVAPWYAMGATLNAGLALNWFRDLFDSSSDGIEPAARFERAGTIAPGANGLLFLPYLAGERTPHFDPDARGAFFGLDPSHCREHLERAVLEGIGFALLDAWQVVQEVTASRPERIVLAGGGARSDVWRQIIADQFGLPVVTPRSDEHSATGAAMLAAASLGAEIDDLVHRWVRYAPPIDPRPEIHERYRSLHSIFQAAYESSRMVNTLLAKWRPADRAEPPLSWEQTDSGSR